MKIVVFDPGKTTGWCAFVDDVVVDYGAIYSMEDAIETFEVHENAEICVYEGFARANASTGDQLQAIEMCGAIQCLATMYKMELVKQYPANRKGYLPLAKQIVKGLAVEANRRAHVVDAVAHGIRYLHKKGVFPWQERYCQSIAKD